jgi:serine protease Do
MGKTRNLGEVAEDLRRSTVRIVTQARGAEGNGSGVIWNANGTVVTNAHVVRDHAQVELWDGSVLPSEVAERDSGKDLAWLKVKETNLPALPWRDSRSLRPGDPVVAVGNPLGFIGALTTGTVRGCGPVRGWDDRHWIQASIRLAPGNSGGPLADSEGRLVGINTLVINSRGGMLALAIPAEAVADFLAHGPRPALGVVVRPVGNPVGQTGLLVLEVAANSLADYASLKTGDMLVSANGREFSSVRDLGLALDQSIGKILRLQFLRGDRSSQREVSIALPCPRREAAR